MVLPGHCGHCGNLIDALGKCSNPDCPKCLAAGTLVLKPDGWCPIEDIKRQDLIMTYDLKNGHLKQEHVIRTFSFPKARLWRIETSKEKNALFTTKYHTFRTAEAWKHTSKLASGDFLFRVGQNTEISYNEIIDVQKTEKFEPVFNIVTSGSNNFIIPHSLTHSFTYFKNLHSLAYKALDFFDQFDVTTEDGKKIQSIENAA